MATLVRIRGPVWYEGPSSLRLNKCAMHILNWARCKAAQSKASAPALRGHELYSSVAPGAWQ